MRLGDRASPHLPFLDGLRGLAALYVVFHHAWFEVAWTGGNAHWPIWLVQAVGFLACGQHAVDLFIVLSGFCLALPIVTRNAQPRPGEFSGFVRRRFRRIVPPYLAAVACSFLLMMLFPILQERTGDRWDDAITTHSVNALLSHVLLIHNLRPETAYAFNPPLWSVATEWQIYFLFALVMLPVYRKFGAIWLAIVCILSSWGLSRIQIIAQASPWMIGLFALGVLMADICFGRLSTNLRPVLHRHARLVLRSGLGIYAIAIFAFAQFFWLPGFWTDLGVGLIFAAIIAAFTLGPSVARSILESRVIMFLGKMSYSLYLVHFPILALVHLHLQHAGFGAGQRLGLMLFASVPLAVLCAWAFHVIFERPFIKTRATRGNAVVFPSESRPIKVAA